MLCTPGTVKMRWLTREKIDRAAERPALSVFAAFERMEIIDERLLDALLDLGEIGVVIDDRLPREFPRADRSA